MHYDDNDYPDDFAARCFSAMWLWYAVRVAAAGALLAGAMRLL